MLDVLLALTLFISAFLLFWCQPLVAKMVLPFLGGSASVWTTCVLFFQIVLLVGYIYAHLLARKLQLRNQFLVHAVLLLAALAFLPIQFNTEPGSNPAREPMSWLMLHLLTSVGIPFFVVSTTAPLLQNWLAATQSRSGKDPYILYAASNAGSLLALLIFPLWLEPQFGSRLQSRFWMGGYIVFAMFVLISATRVWKFRRLEATPHSTPAAVASPTGRMRLYWLAAAFVPSALMLAVTTHISVNLASVPFLWVLPLAVYLLTFILAFRKTVQRSLGHFALLSRFSPLVLLIFLPIIPDVEPPGPAMHWSLIAGHITLLLFGAYFCHTALAAHRPDPAHLTEFYFWLALGGALGGTFAALIAPRIFNTVFEYPLLIAAIPFFRKSAADEHQAWKDWAYPALLLAAFVAKWYLLQALRIDFTVTVWAAIPDVVFFVAVFLCRKRRLRFALGFAALLISYCVTMPVFIEGAQRVYVVRNFFGVKKVLFNENGNYRKLIHGDTLHGMESMDPFKSGQPTAYYHPEGPIGEVMLATAGRPNQRMGVIGLGTATMAAYASAQRHVTFFDVDPQVETIARGYFTFLKRCQANCDVVIGDGRISMGNVPDGTFDVLMLDAFSSDSIPAHLVSREALSIYIRKLKPAGVLLFHVSNRYLDVAKLVNAEVTAAGLVALYKSDREINLLGKIGADCVVAARHWNDFGTLFGKRGWNPMVPETTLRPWTDDYSNLLNIVRWR